MQLLWSDLDLGSNQRVVGVAVCAVVHSGVADTVQGVTSCDDQVELMPVFRSGVSPRSFVACFVLEVGVCHTQIVVAAEFK